MEEMEDIDAMLTCLCVCTCVWSRRDAWDGR